MAKKLARLALNLQAPLASAAGLPSLEGSVVGARYGEGPETLHPRSKEETLKSGQLF